MKYLSTVAFIFLVFISCQTTDKKADKHSNELIEKFKPFLHGTWIPADYIDAVVKTKSPLKASKKMTLISEFSIDTTGLSEDSILVNGAFGNHEGGDFVIYFKQGKTSTSLLTSLISDDKGPVSYELGYTTTGLDTSLVLYGYDKNKKLVEETKYIKVRENNLNDESGDEFQYEVNKELVAGFYTVPDSVGNEIKVELTANGKIKGLPDFKNYYIITDFVAADEPMRDEICFEIQTKDQKCYGFKITDDTLNLFGPVKNGQDTPLTTRQTIYRFIRQH